jgi:hypothetical protein
VTRDTYLDAVGFELRDLPWGMRRRLLAELGDHLAELPDGTDLVERLGLPQRYASELRTAAGLERRRGPVAFLRARRLRNLLLVAVALTVLGLGIGAVAWIDNYQPLATGNSGYVPGAKSSPAGDGIYYVFRQGKRLRYGMTIWNRGRFTVRVLGVPDFYKGHVIGVPVSGRLLMSAPTNWAYGGIPTPYTPFRPFDLKPGEQRGLIFSGVYDQPCPNRPNPGGSVQWWGLPVRFSFLWRTTTVEIAFPQTVAFAYPKRSECPGAKR